MANKEIYESLRNALYDYLFLLFHAVQWQKRIA